MKCHWVSIVTEVTLGALNFDAQYLRAGWYRKVILNIGLFLTQSCKMASDECLFDSVFGIST